MLSWTGVKWTFLSGVEEKHLNCWIFYWNIAETCYESPFEWDSSWLVLFPMTCATFWGRYAAFFFFFFKGTFRSPPTSGASRVEDVAFDIDVCKFNFVQQMATQYKYLKTPSEMWQELMKLLCSNTPTCFHLVCGDVSLYYKLIFQNNHVLAALRCLYS